jgi:UDP-3-O-[3-hydroxymyristoyl] N-acetylglucosamine deacetylase
MSSLTEIQLSGPGLHDGVPARLGLSLRPPTGPHTPSLGADSGASGARSSLTHPGGIRFLLPEGNDFSMEHLGGLAREANRSTLLRGPMALPQDAGPQDARPHGHAANLPAFPAVLKTPEHLLASLLFFPGLPLDIRCDAAEIPGLDGSALPFREALSRLAPERAARPAWNEYPSNLSWEYHWSYGWIRVRPAARFRVRFELERPPLRQAFVLEDAATAWSHILPARTFAFHREWLHASSQGLMAGADADSGLLLAESREEHASLLAGFLGAQSEGPKSGGRPPWRGGPFPLLNQSAWRMEDEPVKHKILDLLGDLALIGCVGGGGARGPAPAGPALPALDIEIRNGGHRINHLLLDQILAFR